MSFQVQSISDIDIIENYISRVFLLRHDVNIADIYTRTDEQSRKLASERYSGLTGAPEKVADRRTEGSRCFSSSSCRSWIVIANQIRDRVLLDRLHTMIYDRAFKDRGHDEWASLHVHRSFAG